MICTTKEEADLFNAAIAYEQAWDDSRAPALGHSMLDAMAAESMDWHCDNCRDELVAAAIRYARSLKINNYETSNPKMCD